MHRNTKVRLIARRPPGFPRLQQLVHLALFLGLLACSSAVQNGSQDKHLSETPSVRAIWITRWDYQTESDVRKIVQNCADAGFNNLLFQVRGNATTFFPSTHEPWAEQFNWQDPGFDPLQVAITEAHSRNMELHAWMNVVPAWWGAELPSDPNHVVNAHPEWLWYDQAGKRQPASENFYLSLNPCLPEVRTHITSVFREVAANYDVDGIHFDYIRFPNEPPAVLAGRDYPRDARTLKLFELETHVTPEQNPEAWNTWRADQVTGLLRELGQAIHQESPLVEISAAVGSEAHRAMEHFQDWETWIEEQLVDTLYPMNYTGDDELFSSRMATWLQHSQNVSVVMGLHANNSTPATLLERASSAETDLQGFAMFGYLYLWESANQIIDLQNTQRAEERTLLRQELLPLPAPESRP